MKLIKTVIDRNNTPIANAEHLINRIEIIGNSISFLLQSYNPERGREDEELPFNAVFYHCALDTGTGIYQCCFNYLATLEEFKGGDLVV